uniref:Uncharacterized protein n=1 Tax=viral metagenome TaxID=1070528 RepID=A0A6C0DFQ9_9ZZZZ
MNKLLILFIILLVGLLLCYFLGRRTYTEGFTTEVETITGVSGNKATVVKYESSSNPTPTLTTSNPYDNYNHFNGSSYPTKFYGPNGTTATVLNKDGTYSLVITDTAGKTTIYSVDAPSPDTTITQTTFYGPNGGTAKITKDNNGNYIINLTMPDGSTSIYTVTTTQGQTVPPPPPSQEEITSTKSTYTIGQNYTPLSSSGSTGSSGYDYSSSLPKGIPKSLIPKGQEDLYILKSEVVPPVCPACPACSRGISSGSSNSGLTPGSQGGNTNVSGNTTSGTTNSGSGATTSGGSFLDSFSNNYMESTKCPPCPACARCPEPAFDCKKVPNYNSINNSYLPMPVLSDFSNFGM